jgi:hypothetical protein
MSKILHTGTAIIMLGLAGVMTAPAFARSTNFGGGASPQPTTRVNDNTGHAGPTPTDAISPDTKAPPAPTASELLGGAGDLVGRFLHAVLGH